MTFQEQTKKEIERLRKLSLVHVKDKNEFGFKVCSERICYNETKLEGYKLAQKEILEKIDEQIKHREELIKENHPHHDKVIPYWKCENIVLKELKTQFSPNQKVPNKLQEKSRLDSNKLNDITTRKDVI